ncbi:MAG: transcription elongation factor Spt5 [Nitrososphaerota archaeon]|nr:transcription elongation factor Spt5 [Candidatus Calditenuis fumarioli]
MRVRVRERGMGKLFAIRTTAGHERNVAVMIEGRIPESSRNVHAIVVLPTLRGFVFVEGTEREVVAELVRDVRHVKSRAPVQVDVSEVSKHLVERPLIETISEGMTVEVIAGPFKGFTGKVTRVDRMRKEVTLELLESSYPFPISVPVNQVRPMG